MTDRIKSLVVVLEQEIRSDDVEFLVNAIRALRYVADVEPRVVGLEDYEARARIRDELRLKLFESIDKTLGFESYWTKKSK